MTPITQGLGGNLLVTQGYGFAFGDSQQTHPSGVYEPPLCGDYYEPPLRTGVYEPPDRDGRYL